MRDHRRFLAPGDPWDTGTIEAWLGEARSQWPKAAVMEWRDARFDQAALLGNGTGGDGRSNQMLAVRRGGVVLRQTVRFHGDLADHLDDFAAVLAVFQ